MLLYHLQGVAWYIGVHKMDFRVVGEVESGPFVRKATCSKT